jgi:hypothetical protein
MAASNVCKEALWWAKFNKDFSPVETGPAEPIPIRSESQTSLELIKNAAVSNASKHKDVV